VRGAQLIEIRRNQNAISLRGESISQEETSRGGRITTSSVLGDGDSGLSGRE